MFQDTSLSPFPKSWLFTAHCLRAQEKWCEAEGKSRASSWMDGSWMDGAGQLWNQKPGRYPKGGRCIPSLGILPQEAVRLGSRPGGSRWLSHGPALGSSLPHVGSPVAVDDLGSLAEPSPNKPCHSPGISGTLKSSVQRNAVREAATQVCPRLRTLSPAWS